MEILLKQKKLGTAETPSRICASSLASVVLSAYSGVIETAAELVRQDSSSHSEYSMRVEGKQKYSVCPQSIVANRFLWGGLFRSQFHDVWAASQEPPVSS